MGQVHKFRPWRITRPSNWIGEAPPRDWMLEGLALKKTVMIFNGPGSVGKSLLMQQLMTCCSVGRDFLGLPMPKVNSFGWFAEDPAAEMHRRQNDINAYLDIDPADTDGMSLMCSDDMDDATLYAGPTRGSNEGHVTPQWLTLREHVLDENCRVVVIDNVQLTFGGNANYPEQVGGFMRELKKLANDMADNTGGLVALIQHPSAEGINSKSGESGARAWSNLSRSRLYMTFPKEYDDEEDGICNERIIKTMKNNYGPRKGPMRVEWRNGVFVPVAVSVASGGRLDTIQLMELRSRIVLAVRDMVSRGDKVSLTKGAPDHVATRLGREPAWKMYGWAEIDSATTKLVDDGKIVVVDVGSKSRVRRLIRTPDKSYPGEEGVC